MPIRLNLLAEIQDAEDLKRRDPVRRAVWVAVVLVSLMLLWSSYLQAQWMGGKVEMSRREAQYAAHTNQYSQVISNQTRLAEVTARLAALERLATNRFLQGDLLDALQHTTVAGVQLLRLRSEQTYLVVPEVPAKKEGGKFIPGTPGSSTEKIRLILEARDISPNPGNERINHFKEVISQYPYFEREHVSTNSILLKDLSSPSVDKDSGVSSVRFTFECTYPDRVRTQ